MDENYQNVAKKLGLVYRAPSGWAGASGIEGEIGGIHVEAHYGRDETYASARLTSAAAFGLSIATAGLLGKFGHLFGMGHAPFGDAQFQATFSVKARDAFVLPLVLTPGVCAALLDAAARGFHPSVDDQWVKLWHWPEMGVPTVATSTEAHIELGIREALRIAGLVSAAFSAAPLAAAKRQ